MRLARARALLVRTAFLAGFVGLLLAIAAMAAGDGAPPRAGERFDTVVLDAGHGGEDKGAIGPRGTMEKDVALDVARRLASELSKGGTRVVLTRKGDVFVPLEERTAIANDARGDLFLSIHANAAPDGKVRGTETFFLSLDASDDSARRVAERENRALGKEGASLPASGDPLLAILGDMIATEHLQESSEFARLAQTRLAGTESSPSRGVKQAPFVVLTGVQMPASLVEIGFITNRADESRLGSEAGRSEIAASLAEAVREFARRYDARRGVARGGRR